MSVLFISAINFASSSSLGISSKVMAQAKAAEEAGHDVYISKDYSTETVIVRPLSGEVVARQSCKVRLSRHKKYGFLSKWVVEHNIDAVMVRFDHLDGAFSNFAKKMRVSGIVVALELPTFPFEHERDVRHKRLLESHKYVQYFARRAFAHLENFQIDRADHYIDYTVTYLDEPKIWGVPNITYDNGIDLSAIRMREPREQDDEVRLLAVAKFAKHHGMDRIIRGLAEYRGERKVMLTLVGVGSASQELSSLVAELGVGDQVRFVGIVVGEDLDRLFDEADIAVGSLGLHRIGISLGSTIKAREYCARGIPFVYSFPEKGFSRDEEFTLMLPSDESPIDITAVITFADRMKADQGATLRMRKFAEAHFDWKVQMDKVLSVLEGESGKAVLG